MPTWEGAFSKAKGLKFDKASKMWAEYDKATNANSLVGKDISVRVMDASNRPADHDQPVDATRGFSQPASRSNNHPRYNTAKNIKKNWGIDKGNKSKGRDY